MQSNFDFYKKLESVDISLCNPDGKRLCILDALDRNPTLRFNDISEISFSVPLLEGKEKYYRLVESKRLVYVDNIGWFQISSATESVRGAARTKQVTAQSLQVVFKNKGFVREDRVYMFYNPNDPTDSEYQSSNVGAMPSVVGQLYRQLGIKLRVSNVDREIVDDFGEWTLVYIPKQLTFQSAGGGNLMYTPRDGAVNICRSFTDNDTTYGYDFMVNDVSPAFEVVFEFDYLHHAIKVKTIDEIVKPTDIYLSFENLLKELSLQEKSDDIVTVLSCNGKDLDIRTVNPMGTNYLVNFDYYAKEVSDDGKIAYPWMSRELIEALKQWKQEWEQWQRDDPSRTGHAESYQTLVGKLQKRYQELSEIEAQITAGNLWLTDLCTARDQFIDDKDKDDKAGVDLDGGGYIMAEKVEGTDTRSLLSNSPYAQAPFNGSSRVTGYKSAPTVSKDDDGRYVFTFGGESKQGTASEMIDAYTDDETGDDSEPATYMYFGDTDPATSYCKILVAARVEVTKDSDGVATTSGSGTVTFDDVVFTVTSQASTFKVGCPDGSTKNLSTSNSYFIYNGIRYKVAKSADNVISIHCYYVNGFERYSTYQAAAGYEGFDGWCTLWEKRIAKLNRDKAAKQTEIDTINALLEYISDRCEVRKFISRQNGGEALVNELDHYWIEGDYENDTLAALDDTTMSETIELAEQLMSAGTKELEKVSKPTFEMSVDAVNFIRIPEFAKFTRQLELGRTITIEKDDETRYEPVLMSVEYSLDNPDTFTLTFSTAGTNCEVAKTFGDLIKESSSTSRSISSNWSILTDYSRSKETLTTLVAKPLERSLRAVYDTVANQEFTVDETGILGRRRNEEGSEEFLPEQVRLTNNTIIFTRNNWKSTATALGKIILADGTSAYGLAAEVLIGDLIFGSQVHIKNDGGNITLDENGITIKDSDGNVHFQATPDGTVSVSGYATDAALNDVKTTFEASVEGVKAEITQAVSDTYAPKEASSKTFGYSLTADGFKLYDQSGEDDPVLYANSNGIEVRGKITSDSGRIGALYVEEVEGTRIDTEQQEFSCIVSTTIPAGAIGTLDDSKPMIYQYTYGVRDVRWTLEDLLEAAGLSIEGATICGVELENNSKLHEGITLQSICGTYIELAGWLEGKTSTLLLAYRLTATCKVKYYTKTTKIIRYPVVRTPDKTFNISSYEEQGFVEASDLQVGTAHVHEMDCAKINIGALSISDDNADDTVIGTRGSGFFFDDYDDGATDRYTAHLEYSGNTIMLFVDGGLSPPQRDCRFGIEYKTTTSDLVKTTSLTIVAGQRSAYITIPLLGEITMAQFPNGKTTTSFQMEDGAWDEAAPGIGLFGGGIYPSRNGESNLGTEQRKWKMIFAKEIFTDQDSNTSSDRNLKKNISCLDERHERFFDNLVPVKYQLKDDDSGKYHLGLIAQDVKCAMDEAGLIPQDYAIYAEWVRGKGNISRSLKYGEFIPLTIREIQLLKKRLIALENSLSTTKNEK